MGVFQKGNTKERVLMLLYQRIGWFGEELRRAYAARRSCAGAEWEVELAGAAGLLSWKRTRTSLVVSCSRVFGLCSLRVAFEANWQS